MLFLTLAATVSAAASTYNFQGVTFNVENSCGVSLDALSSQIASNYASIYSQVVNTTLAASVPSAPSYIAQVCSSGDAGRALLKSLLDKGLLTPFNASFFNLTVVFILLIYFTLLTAFSLWYCPYWNCFVPWSLC